jgi:general stress protein 26
MTDKISPVGTRIEEFSEGDAPPVTWDSVDGQLRTAEMFWLSTVRVDGRPHVAPLPAVWLHGNLHFVTGSHEQKARNVAHQPRCALTTGTNEYRRGRDVVVEGTAHRIAERGVLQVLAQMWMAKYDWPFEATDEGFLDPQSDRAPAAVFAVVPVKVLVFTKNPYSQTRFSMAST